MKLFLNICWFVLGGWISGTAWLVAGCLLALTIIGLPWTPAAFRIASYSYWPFGRQLVDRQHHTGVADAGTGAPGLLMNIVWFVLAGWWLTLHHLALALAFAVTIIGIPFAWANLKLAVISLAPVGKTVVHRSPVGLLA